VLLPVLVPLVVLLVAVFCTSASAACPSASTSMIVGTSNSTSTSASIGTRTITSTEKLQSCGRAGLRHGFSHMVFRVCFMRHPIHRIMHQNATSTPDEHRNANKHEFDA
jgi:hypothetical protein